MCKLRYVLEASFRKQNGHNFKPSAKIFADSNSFLTRMVD